MTELVTIRTKGGVPFTVARSSSDKFEGLLNDLEASGYPIQSNQSGGYNYRNIAGTEKLSNHAHGTAVDVNWTNNPRGGAGNIPAATARELAAKHGMTWGGDWKNPDPMHFEVAGGSVPLQNRGMTTVAGLSPGSAPIQPDQQTAASGQNGGQAMNPLMMLMQALGGGASPQAAGQPSPAAFGSLNGQPQPQPKKDYSLGDPMAAAQMASGDLQAPQLLGRRMAQAPDVNRVRQAVRGRLGLMG